MTNAPTLREALEKIHATALLGAIGGSKSAHSRGMRYAFGQIVDILVEFKIVPPDFGLAALSAQVPEDDGLLRRLKHARAEMIAEGVNGWPNVVAEAADRIEALSRGEK